MKTQLHLLSTPCPWLKSADRGPGRRRFAPWVLTLAALLALNASARGATIIEDEIQPDGT